MKKIYKIVPSDLWKISESKRVFCGSPVDIEDGYIHFSTSKQVRETAAKHFKGQNDLILVAVESEKLGDSLKWEESRGGDLFPHLYGDLPIESVTWTKALPLGADGIHEFPELDD